MSWFNKYYHCDDCGTDWQDQWDCLCNDRCPTCDAETQLHDYAQIDEGCLDTGTGPSFIMIIPKRRNPSENPPETSFKEEEKCHNPDEQAGIMCSPTERS